jgi:hypothetical protein
MISNNSNSDSPPRIVRGLTRKQAAAFFGLCTSAFDKFKREGKIPAPTLPGKRYDLQLLQATMDRFSGISTGDGLSPLETWRKRRGTRAS